MGCKGGGARRHRASHGRGLGHSPQRGGGSYRGGCMASEASPLCLWSASEVCVSAPIELRQGSGGAAPRKFLGNCTLLSAFLQ